MRCQPPPGKRPHSAQLTALDVDGLVHRLVESPPEGDVGKFSLCGLINALIERVKTVDGCISKRDVRSEVSAPEGKRPHTIQL